MASPGRHRPEMSIGQRSQGAAPRAETSIREASCGAGMLGQPRCVTASSISCVTEAQASAGPAAHLYGAASSREERRRMTGSLLASGPVSTGWTAGCSLANVARSGIPPRDWWRPPAGCGIGSCLLQSPLSVSGSPSSSSEGPHARLLRHAKCSGQPRPPSL